MEKKVLFTASTHSHILYFHRPYLRAFAARGWTVDVACGGTAARIPEARRVIPLPLEKSITAPANLKAAHILRRELKQERYTLVSAHTTLAAFFTRLAAWGMPAVVVNTCHGYLFDANTPAPKRLLLLGAEKLTAARTDLLLTMNRCDLALAQKYRLSKRILPVPGVGVDFAGLGSVTPAAGAALRRELDIPPEAFVLLYPAEFSRRKCQKTLLEALARLPEPIYLLLPGDGALLQTCRALAQRLNVAGRVRFPGRISGMGAWYAAADCAVSSSRSEGLPFNIMEAMYAGLPVVASAVKGHEDLVRDGENGFLFPWGDASGCARQVLRLLSDPALARRMGEAGAREAEKYRLERVLPVVMAAYGEALEGRL